MIRTLTGAVGALFILAGVVLFISPREFALASVPGSALVLISMGVVVLAGTALEPRYRSRSRGVGIEWQETDERFVDPTTGKLTTVRYNPSTGERAYVVVD